MNHKTILQQGGRHEIPHEVDLCDEYCPFYEKSSYGHRFIHNYAPFKKFLVIVLSVGVALNKR